MQENRKINSNFASKYLPIHIMSNYLPPIKVFAGTKSHYLGESICKDLGHRIRKNEDRDVCRRRIRGLF